MKQYSQRKANDRFVHDFKIYGYENCHDYPIFSQSIDIELKFYHLKAHLTFLCFQTRN